MSNAGSNKAVKSQCEVVEKEQFLITAGGKIICRRCSAKSVRTKQQCGKPALAISRTQKCEFHGGRPHSTETLRHITEAKIIHGKTNKASKQQYKNDSILMHQLEDALFVLDMAQGQRTKGRKPLGYWRIRTLEDVARLIKERRLHIV